MRYLLLHETMLMITHSSGSSTAVSTAPVISTSFTRYQLLPTAASICQINPNKFLSAQ